MTPTDTIIALEKALEAYEAATNGLQEQRGLRAVMNAATPDNLRTLLDAHASALRDAAKLREAVSRLLVLARLANWEGDDAAVFAQAALDDNTKGAMSHG